MAFSASSGLSSRLRYDRSYYSNEGHPLMEKLCHLPLKTVGCGDRSRQKFAWCLDGFDYDSRIAVVVSVAGRLPSQRQSRTSGLMTFIVVPAAQNADNV